MDMDDGEEVPDFMNLFTHNMINITINPPLIPYIYMYVYIYIYHLISLIMIKKCSEWVPNG